MKKTWIIILGIFLGILMLMSALVLYLRHVPKIQTSCQINSDCALSAPVRGEENAFCVNTEWLDKWERSPKYKLFLTRCVYGAMCDGEEFKGIYPENDCECVSNECQLINISEYPGCRFVGC